MHEYTGLPVYEDIFFNDFISNSRKPESGLQWFTGLRKQYLLGFTNQVSEGGASW